MKSLSALQSRFCDRLTSEVYSIEEACSAREAYGLATGLLMKYIALRKPVADAKHTVKRRDALYELRGCEAYG